mgnify:CR=1 FL=1
MIYLNYVHHTDNNLLHYDNRSLAERFPKKERMSLYGGGTPQIKPILRGHKPNITIGCIHRFNYHLLNCNGYGKRNISVDIRTKYPDYNNYYVIRKNFCLFNRQSNIIIITKGLNNEEKICEYYIDSLYDTNGMTLCNNNIGNTVAGWFIKKSTVVLTKLSNFIPFLSDKNLALIKMDIEGSEGIVIEDGIELISKYHVPFIFVEFSPKYLTEHHTDPKKFIHIF